MKAIVPLLLVASVCSAAFVDIGQDELPMNKPFCGDCFQNLRYQILELDSEIGSALTITSISFKRSPVGGEGFVGFDEFRIYIGLCQTDQMSEIFEDNYIAGSKILVYDQDDVTITAGATDEWFDLVLDTPYFYAGHDNLLIDFQWTGGEHSIYNWGWTAGTARAVSGGYGETYGSAESAIPHIRLNGTVDLESTTFGALKAGLGS